MPDEADISRRLLELERRMDLLFDHLKIEEPRLVPRAGDAVPGVQALLDKGDKVGAIALVVQRTGMGLGEAKRTVDQMAGGS
jgi:hypothetical protein